MKIAFDCIEVDANRTCLKSLQWGRSREGRNGCGYPKTRISLSGNGRWSSLHRQTQNSL